MYRILIVEDDMGIAQAIKNSLICGIWMQDVWRTSEMFFLRFLNAILI